MVRHIRTAIAIYAAGLLASGALARAEDAPPLHPILDPAFQLELNASTNSVLSVSDEIDVLVDGKESYPMRWRMLEGAQDSIHITTLYIFHDATTKRLGDMLVRKKNEGVDVKIIVYGIYAWGNPFFYRKMRQNDIEVQKYSGVAEVLLQPYRPMRFWKRHLHDKYVVVDGREALMGGMNWSSRYAQGGRQGGRAAWRDTDIWVRGPQAAIVEKEFQKRWYLEEGEDAKAEAVSAELEAIYAQPLYPPEQEYMDFFTPSSDAPGGYRVEKLTRFLYQQPFEQNGATYMTTYYKEVMDRAQSHIWWQSIATRPAPVQKKALLEAAARGVEVRLMSNSERNMRMIPIGGWPLYRLAKAGYRELLEGGIRIFEYHGDAPMHAKGFLVDDVVTVVGSYNATFTAEKYYTENAVATHDTGAIQEVIDMFEDDLAQCTEVTLEDLEPPKQRLTHARRGR